MRKILPHSVQQNFSGPKDLLMVMEKEHRADKCVDRSHQYEGDINVEASIRLLFLHFKCYFGPFFASAISDK